MAHLLKELFLSTIFPIKKMKFLASKDPIFMFKRNLQWDPIPVAPWSQRLIGFIITNKISVVGITFEY